MRFVDLFAGLGGFHRALHELGHRCVFAAESNPELRDIYSRNFPYVGKRLKGDIRLSKSEVPAHEILCAGFPCQPFSKSGAQLGPKDETRGTLFHEILAILEARRPPYVLLENVGNFARHDRGRTWEVVRRRLEGLDYVVVGTEHVTPAPLFDWRDSGSASRARFKLPGPANERRGTGLLSPHHFGQPHHRERFFIMAVQPGLPVPVFPARRTDLKTSLASIVQNKRDLTHLDKLETRLTGRQVECIELWNALLQRLPKDTDFPAGPIWADEFALAYPYLGSTPFAMSPSKLRLALGHVAKGLDKPEMLALLPSYAREEVGTFRQWKINYISRNRDWWSAVRRYAPKNWLNRLRELPPSLRKLEWNVRGGDRDLWKHALQFRPSGLRAKRYSSSPALVAMTCTQIPILGPERRFLTRTEGLRLQGFPDRHELPKARAEAFKALGNAVHVLVAKAIAAALTNDKALLTVVEPSHDKQVMGARVA